MAEVLRRRWRALLLAFLATVGSAAVLAPAGAMAAPGTGAITGTISDAAGPVSGATVVAYPVGDPGDTTSSPLTSHGTYTISGLGTGTYEVEATPPSGSSDVATYDGNAGDPYTATDVSVTNAATTGGVNITMSAGGTVVGTITNSGGAGVANVTVDVADADGVTVRAGQTASGGTYSVTGLAPGTYYVYVDASAVDASHAQNYASGWYGPATPGSSSALDESNASAITVTSTSTTPAAVNQVLGNGGEITGSVADATGDLAGTSVYAEDGAGTTIGQGQSGSNGLYTIYGVPTGSYVLEFVTPPNAGGVQVDAADAYYGGATAAESPETATAVPVTDAVASTANFTVPPGGDIAGAITANANAASDVPVRLYDSAGNLIDDEGTTSAADGVYEISGLVPGTYKVEFGASEGEPANAANLGFQFYDNVSTLAAASSVTVTAGQLTPSINAALTTGGQITGTVISAASKAALPGVTVDLLDSAGHVLESTTTVGGGTYTLSGVPTGSYDVEFIPAPGQASQYQTQYYLGAQVLSAANPVPVSAGDVTANVNVALVGATAAETPVRVPYVPTLTATVPTISGTAKVGKVLRAEAIGWTPQAQLNYQWYAAGKAIKGATRFSLTLTGAEYRKAITVAVLGKASGYTWVTQTSAATKAVAEGTLKTAVPKISGTAKVGDKLTAKPGTWTKGAKFTYQWYANKRAIRGATKSTFKLARAQQAKTVTLKVTGKLTGYASVAKTSRATRRVLLY